MTQSYKVLIVDDEPISRRRMRRLLSLEPDYEVVAECANGEEAVDALRLNKVDVLFIDIQMPGMSGFEVLEAITEVRPLVIFTSACDEYAVKAFDVHAFDYLLKPFDGHRFRDSLRRAKARLEMDRAGGQRDRDMSEMFASFTRAQKTPDRVAVRNNGRVVFVKVDEIDWVEASDNYVCLHVGRETHVIRETMNQLEARLVGTQFLRVHRSAIVNLDRIKEMQPWFRGDYRVILRDGTELTLTKNHREKLESRLLLGAGAR